MSINTLHNGDDYEYEYDDDDAADDNNNNIGSIRTYPEMYLG